MPASASVTAVLIVLLGVIASALAVRPVAAGAGTWRPPLAGGVVGPFVYDGARPFAAGQRRGVDLAARRGEPVRAVCGGRVAFAGRVPAVRGGGSVGGVSVRCGRVTATLLGLRRIAVRRGAWVVAGTPVGIAAGRVLRLGARWTASRGGYVDPLALFGDDGGDRPLLPPRPRPRAMPDEPPGAAPPAPAARPVPHGRQVPALRATGDARATAGAAAQALPAGAWVGLCVAAAGVGTGGLARRRRTRRATAHGAVAGLASTRR